MKQHLFYALTIAILAGVNTWTYYEYHTLYAMVRRMNSEVRTYKGSADVANASATFLGAPAKTCVCCLILFAVNLLAHLQKHVFVA